MKKFNQLVAEQMRTMEKLIFLHSELERCQEVEAALLCLHEDTNIKSIRAKIARMRDELNKIQTTFDVQTEELIKSYRSEKVT
ncbi:hypothetical protein J9303_15635 [Bacillaceae bacterium Marseille-Q3522]|nr:hypothetical protein [Bacillaceae bacterium Marseille-Q3522]